MWMSKCFGCGQWIKHMLDEEDESLVERTHCDKCLADMHWSPRGTFLAWKQSSLPVEEEA